MPLPPAVMSMHASPVGFAQLGEADRFGDVVEDVLAR